MRPQNKKSTLIIQIGVFNEQENIVRLVKEISQEMDRYDDVLDWKILFIDNNSADNTFGLIRDICESDKRVCAIRHEFNYGAALSSYHGLTYGSADCRLIMCADFQDPPSLIPTLIDQWLQGASAVMARKKASEEALMIRLIRKGFYTILMACNPLYEKVVGCTGFGIYDNVIVERLITMNQNPPFFRAMVAECCNNIVHVDYSRPQRLGGKSSMNFYRLYDEGVIGLIQSSMIPIRTILFLGATTGVLCFIAGLAVLVLKLLFWDIFPIGVAPTLILNLFTSSLVLMSIAVLGEYVGFIAKQQKKGPFLYAKEKLNLDE